MSNRHRLAATIAVAAFALAGCATGTGGSTAPSAVAAASHDPADVSSAVASFVGAMQAGDGGTACGYLDAEETKLFVDNAATVPDFAAAATDCEAVVAAFPTVAGALADDLDGTLQDISMAGDIAFGSWTYRTGDQDVMLQYGADGWQFGYHSNDFPSALLHINE